MPFAILKAPVYGFEVNKLEWLTMHGSRKFCLISFFFRGARLQKPHKAGKYRPASETSLKWRFAGAPIMVRIECWLGSFVIFKVLVGNPIDF